METTMNLKRRRDSGEGAAKKMCPEKTHPEAGPSSQTQLPLPSPPLPSPLPPPPFPPPKITLQSPPRQMDPLSLLSPQQEHFSRNITAHIKSPSPDLSLLKGHNPRA